MRLVPTSGLQDGDIIAKDIISDDGGMLLRAATTFREAFKTKLIERDIKEVYIEDEISKGIEPVDIVTPTIRKKMAQDIRGEFDKLQNHLELDTENLANVTQVLIEELGKKEVVCELADLKCNHLYTYEHCISVAILAALVCDRLKFNLYLKEQIVMGALIHDIGKIILPKNILNKADRLSKEEYELVKTHTEVGYKMIKEIRALSAVTKLIVLCHHEREDGSGYPLGKGEDLHIGTKIVAACDLFHALISDRCYRQGLPINEVFKIAQTEKINPQIREVIEGTFAFYPVGSMVKLSTGQIGIVEKNFAQNIKKPLIRVIHNIESKDSSWYKMNLQEEADIYIVGRYEQKG